MCTFTFTPFGSCGLVPTLADLKNLKFLTCKVNSPTLLTKWNLPFPYAWAKVTKDINSNNKIMLILDDDIVSLPTAMQVQNAS